MAKKIYKEEQGFNNIEIPLFIGFFMLLAILKLIREISLPNGSAVDGIVCVSLIILGMLGIRVLQQSSLKLVLTENYVKFKMTPWHTNTQKIAWEEIEHCEVVRTPIFAQWHGGNIVYGQQKRFTFSGKNGLRFTTKDGTSYFVGSRNLDALEVAAKDALQKSKAKLLNPQMYTPSSVASIFLRPI